MANNTYNFIDLFCGCGGFSKGLEMAGHKCLLGVDFQERKKKLKKSFSFRIVYTTKLTITI